MSIRRAVTNLPIPKKLMLIIGLFSVVTLLLLALSYGGMEILSAIRAFVGGEGLWSKSQKEAVLRLDHYAGSHAEKDYQDYLTALEIPLGDHQARLELEKPAPDTEVAFSGFLRGANHPRDIPGMIHLFRRFRRFSYIDRAIRIWEQGDKGIAAMQKTGDGIRREVASGHESTAVLEPLLKEIQITDADLTPLENAFSSTLGEGARWTQNLILALMILSTVSFLATVVAVALLISRHLCGEIDQLRAGVARIARGDFDVSLTLDSNDEIGELARAFQEMAEHVEAANQELESFSYSVSHDLRAPLRAIEGFSQELLRNSGAPLPPRDKQDLERICAATQRMAQLIEDLLELARLSRKTMEWTDIDLSAMVQDIAQTLVLSAPQRKVTWTITPHMMLRGDSHLIRIALENLMQNAWKFTQNRPETTIAIGLSKTDSPFTFFIRDNGAGFNMAYVDKLFKPFERLHDSKQYPGTGIGLALVQRIIRRHGGEIRAESQENVGTTFYFTFKRGIA